jgi:hypothetical protein
MLSKTAPVLHVEAPGRKGLVGVIDVYFRCASTLFRRESLGVEMHVALVRRAPITFKNEEVYGAAPPLLLRQLHALREVVVPAIATCRVTCSTP